MMIFRLSPYCRSVAMDLPKPASSDALIPVSGLNPFSLRLAASFCSSRLALISSHLWYTVCVWLSCIYM